MKLNIIKAPFGYKSILNADEEDIIIDMLDGKVLTYSDASSGNFTDEKHRYQVVGVCDTDDNGDTKVVVAEDFETAEIICDKFGGQAITLRELYDYIGEVYSDKIDTFYIFNDELSQVIDVDGTRTLYDFRVCEDKQEIAFKMFMKHISNYGSEPVPETCNMEDIIF